MKVPKTKKKYCPHCRSHIEHKISTAKKKTARALTYGSKHRARRRGLARGKGSRGRYSKPALSKFKMTGKKSSKKTDFRFQCVTCKKMQTQNKGLRAKKVEFI